MANAHPWLTYANGNAVRNEPLSPQLLSVLDRILPAMGLSVRVFSGGQPESGPNRVGSHRHDNGNAADLFLLRDGKQLDWANAADRPLFEQFVQQARAAGLTGFGAGPGYMQPGSMHVGFGTPAVWGAGGSSANAPAWLRAAADGTPLPPTAAIRPAVFAPPPSPDANRGQGPTIANAMNLPATAGPMPIVPPPSAPESDLGALFADMAPVAPSFDPGPIFGASRPPETIKSGPSAATAAADQSAAVGRQLRDMLLPNPDMVSTSAPPLDFGALVPPGAAANAPNPYPAEMSFKFRPKPAPAKGGMKIRA